MTDMTTPPDIDAIKANLDDGELKKVCACLYIAVDACVADDVKQKVLSREQFLVDSARALIAEVERLRAQTRWIPVEERLPKQPGCYLTARVPGSRGGEDRRTSFFEDGLWRCRSTRLLEYPTHWMPLPAPPEEPA